jgi:hypothetical protein
MGSRNLIILERSSDVRSILSSKFPCPGIFKPPRSTGMRITRITSEGVDRPLQASISIIYFCEEQNRENINSMLMDSSSTRKMEIATETE